MKKNEMNKMNKGIITVLTIMMATTMALTACGQTSEDAEAETEPVEETVFESEEETIEPLEEEDLEGLLTGIEDHYVLQDAINVNYMSGVESNATVEMDEEPDEKDSASEAKSDAETKPEARKTTKVIHSVTVDDSKVDVSTPGTYKVTYTVKVNRPAYDEYVALKAEEKDDAEATDKAEEGKVDEKAEPVEDDGEEADLEDVIIEKDIEIVDEERAKELVGEGESVWTDDSKDYSEVLEEEKKAAENATNTGTETKLEDTSAKTEDVSDKSADNSNSSDSSKSSGSSSSSSGSSSSKSSGSSNSSSSSKAETHTHSYTGSVTKAATCGSSGTKTYTCSCGASYTESIPATGNHNWQTTYTEKQVWVEDSASYTVYVCKICGTEMHNNAEAKEHDKTCDGNSYSKVYPATGHYETEKVASGSKCSVCGATK